MEIKADHKGLILMASAGYDPRVAPKVFEKLDQIMGLPDGIISTHPSGKTRSKLLPEASVTQEAISIFFNLDTNEVGFIVVFDESFLKTQMETMAEVPSMFFTMVTAKKPGLEIDEVLCVSSNMPGARKEDVLSMISADNNLNITCKIRDQVYKAGMTLPDYFDRARAFSFDLEDGAFKLTLPLVKTTSAVPKNVMKVFFEHDCTTFFCAMMDRSVHDGDIRAAMADLRKKLISFTLHQKETLESIHLEGSVPGLEKMEVTGEAVRVSLNMPGFEIGDVECRFVEYNTLRIEGKKKKGDCVEYFMTGIRTPEGFHGEDRMIKREMEDGVYKVTLPRVDVISEAAKRMTGAFFYKVRPY